jgi:hypothetical protein
MVRNALSKVAWVGRTASMVFGLALVLALVFGVAAMAFGANGDVFRVGRSNLASAISTLTKSGAGPALSLKVGSGAPLAVNSSARVTKLNADKLDSTDSKTFGTFMATSQSITGTCTTAGIWEGCAGYRVTVPAGKVYDVTVWSSVNARSAGSAGTLFYCPAVEGGSFGLSCITVQGRYDTLTLPSGVAVSGASSGEISLPAGDYFISTAIKPSVNLSSDSSLNMHTTLMVQDSSVPRPPTE